MGNKHRRYEHTQRQQGMKNALLEKERAARSDELEAETEPQPENKAAKQMQHRAGHEVLENATSENSIDLRQELECVQTEARRLVASLEEETHARQQERKEKDALKKKLQEAEQEMDKYLKALEREKRENERQRLHYESRVKELEQRALTSVPQKANGEDFPANKASFRIDLYPHQGHFQGKIEHMLTHDKRAFSGVDPVAIGEFITAHLPELESRAEELQKLLTMQRQEEHAPPVLPAASHERASAAAQLAASLRAMEVMLAGTSTRTNMVRDDQSFDVELKLDLAEAEAGSKQCNVALFAKRIDSGARQNIGATKEEITNAAQAFPVRVKGLRLPRGTYRLEALVNVHAAAAMTNANVLAAHKLIQIY